MRRPTLVMRCNGIATACTPTQTSQEEQEDDQAETQPFFLEAQIDGRRRFVLSLRKLSKGPRARHVGLAMRLCDACRPTAAFATYFSGHARIQTKRAQP